MPGKITREKGQHALVGLPVKREKHGLDPAALAAVRGETKKEVVASIARLVVVRLVVITEVSQRID